MIVVIIVGVLAALALPRLFGIIEYARGAEAKVSIGIIRSSVERCYLELQDYSLCLFNKNPGRQSNIDIEDPGDSPNAHFSYRKQQPPPQQFFFIIATRNSLDGGNEGDEIRLRQRNNILTWSGTGAFSSVGN